MQKKKAMEEEWHRAAFCVLLIDYLPGYGHRMYLKELSPLASFISLDHIRDINHRHSSDSIISPKNVACSITPPA